MRPPSAASLVACAALGLAASPPALFLLQARLWNGRPAWLVAMMLSCGALGWIAFRTATGPRERAVCTGWRDGLAGTLSLVLLWGASGAPFNALIEQLGVAASAFLIASALTVPWVLSRRAGALESDLARLPRHFIWPALTAVVVGAVVAAALGWLEPPHFPGGHKRPPRVGPTAPG